MSSSYCSVLNHLSVYFKEIGFLSGGTRAFFCGDLTSKDCTVNNKECLVKDIWLHVSAFYCTFFTTPRVNPLFELKRRKNNPSSQPSVISQNYIWLGLRPGLKPADLDNFKGGCHAIS